MTNKEIATFGDLDAWLVLNQTTSASGCTTTEAMQINRVGCVVRVVFTDPLDRHYSTNMVFVPGVVIKENYYPDGDLAGRELVQDIIDIGDVVFPTAAYDEIL